MVSSVSSFPTPLTPPHTEEEKRSWLRLLRSRRVGPSTFFRLMREHGSAEAALAALPGIARDAGIDDYEICPEPVIAAEIRAARKARARLITVGMPDYPARLAEVADAPPLLWARGDRAMLARPAIALVGARNASSLGRRMARCLALELGEEGYVIVSGLARGIDAEAHRAALARGTVAVFAGGADHVYPTENARLADEIAASGLILSEQPMGLCPQARHFPRRNRIVSGLAEAVVLVEAAARSGSLITAECALDQGREVLAVPGHPLDARASGCNALIRDGATLVRSGADIAAALAARPEGRAQAHDPAGATAEPAATPPPAVAAIGDDGHRRALALHRQILDRLSPSPIAEDQLIRDLGVPASIATPAITSLELDGRVTRQAGGMLSRAQ